MVRATLLSIALWPVSTLGLAETLGAQSPTHAVRPAAVSAAPLGNSGNPPPPYPEIMRSAGVEGVVTLEVRVDTLGEPVPPSLRRLEATHDLFWHVVQAAVLDWRWVPARQGEGPVEAAVRLSFRFVLVPLAEGTCPEATVSEQIVCAVAQPPRRVSPHDPS